MLSPGADTGVRSTRDLRVARGSSQKPGGNARHHPPAQLAISASVVGVVVVRTAGVTERTPGSGGAGVFDRPAAGGLRIVVVADLTFARIDGGVGAPFRWGQKGLILPAPGSHPEPPAATA